MQQLPKVSYSPEFRDESVRLHLEDKLPVTEIAKRLSLPRGTLKNWVAAARQGKLGEIGKSQKPLTEMEIELSKLRRELAEVKMERDLLKKCAAYFARTSA
jgi:transposase